MSSIRKNWNPEDQWVFPEIEPSEKQEKLAVAIVAEIAIKIIFKNFSYTFGGKTYLQKSGGPIGVRATGAVAQLVMENWARTYREILENSGVIVKLLSGYVDDGRQVTSALRPGMRFCEEKKIFIYSSLAEEQDKLKAIKGETNNQRMARICKDGMNSINPDLVFTTESQEDFPSERLPTLDFEMWISGNIIRHSYYQKNMKTPYVIMERSGMSHQQKHQILSNELVRRLSNIQIDEIPHKEILEKIEEFIGELKNSEYNRKQSREIVNSGIRGWKNKIKKRKRQNIPFYRLAQETVDSRLEKQLTERESWYKERLNEDEDDEDPENSKKFKKMNIAGRKPSKNWRTRNIRKHGSESSTRPQVKSVIFVPFTRNSDLAKNLRTKENEIYNITGDKVKIVERVGRKLENILSSRDPWKGLDCGRQNCFLCNTKTLTGKDINKDCKKRNILYEIRCLTCENMEHKRIEETFEDDLEKQKEMKEKIQVPKYIGETGRSAYERGFEHLDQLASLSSKSVMLRHMVDKHGEKEFSEITWGMFIRDYKRSAFERQIDEAVTIERESKATEILNSKSEWNQSQLPRLVTRIGSREEERKELERELEEERKIENKIEEKIRVLRKARNKTRLTTDRGNPAKKRQKMEDTTYVSIRDSWGPPKTSAPRKNYLGENEHIDKKIENKRMRTSERLENIVRIEDKIIQGETITNFEIEIIDWDQRLKEHREHLEQEVAERTRRLKKQEEKEKSWELYRECKRYLEENDKNWQNRKTEREIEIKKIERLHIAEMKKEQIREKVKKRKLEQEIEEKLDKLPEDMKKKILDKEEKQERLDLIHTKKSLWKFRNKEKKTVIDTNRTEKLEKQTKQEEKLKLIENILEEMRREKLKVEEEKRRQEEKNLKEWRTKVEMKNMREQEKRERMKKQQLLSQHWEMLKWATKYIQENQENWDKRRKEEEQRIAEELEQWKKYKRLEKIENLKRKWKKAETVEETLLQNSSPEQTPQRAELNKWRTGKSEKEGVDTIAITPEKDAVPVQNEVRVQINMKTPKLIFSTREIISSKPPKKKVRFEEDNPVQAPSDLTNPPSQPPTPHLNPKSPSRGTEVARTLLSSQGGSKTLASTTQLNQGGTVPGEQDSKTAASTEKDAKRPASTSLSCQGKAMQGKQKQEPGGVASTSLQFQNSEAVQYNSTASTSEGMRSTSPPPMEDNISSTLHSTENNIKYSAEKIIKQPKLLLNNKQGENNTIKKKIVVLKPPTKKDDPKKKRNSEKEKKITEHTRKKENNITKYLVINNKKCSDITSARNNITTNIINNDEQMKISGSNTEIAGLKNDELDSICKVGLQINRLETDIKEEQFFNQSEASISRVLPCFTNQKTLIDEQLDSGACDQTNLQTEQTLHGHEDYSVLDESLKREEQNYSSENVCLTRLT